MDGQLKSLMDSLQGERKSLGAAVLGNIIQRFLKNTVGDHLQGNGNLVFQNVQPFFDLDVGIRRLKFPTEQGKGGQDPQVIQDGRPQVDLPPMDFPNAFLDEWNQLYQGLESRFYPAAAELLDAVPHFELDCR
jgi:hypothetical protein